MSGEKSIQPHAKQAWVAQEWMEGRVLMSFLAAKQGLN